MLKLGGGADAKRLRNQLRTLFRENATAAVRRRLTTPGGVEDDALIYWVELEHGRGIWAHFGAPPGRDENRWICWFGVYLGRVKNEALVPAVEINLPKAPDIGIAGRVLIDEQGQLYLGHRGGLGGGRSGNMPVKEFARRIRGFVTEEFVVPNRSGSELAFLIAAADDPDLLRRLHAYVSECARLRREKRAEASELTRLEEKLPSTKPEAVFNPEAGTDGSGTGSGEREIVRLHGRVVNALQRLVQGLVNSARDDMRPDLYLIQRDRMAALFEVKASSDTQSWFTAIGQLLVYPNGQKPPPRLIFVCPADRRHPAFRGALERLNIFLVTFTVEEPERVSFSGLESALDGIG